MVVADLSVPSFCPGASMRCPLSSSMCRCACGKSRPVYGIPGPAGKGKVRWCRKCPERPEESVNFVQRMCECGRALPSFGAKGDPPRMAKWCSQCRPEDSYCLVGKKCECGEGRPTMGLPGEDPRDCSWCTQCPGCPPEAIRLVFKKRKALKPLDRDGQNSPQEGEEFDEEEEEVAPAPQQEEFEEQAAVGGRPELAAAVEIHSRTRDPSRMMQEPVLEGLLHQDHMFYQPRRGYEPPPFPPGMPDHMHLQQQRQRVHGEMPIPLGHWRTQEMPYSPYQQGRQGYYNDGQGYYHGDKG